MRLTKSVVDGLEFPSQGQPVYWDDTLPGFGIRVSQTVKTYIAQGRVNGKTRRVSLGRHGVITCEKARKEAKKALADMSNGIDPAAVKKAEEALSVTLEEVVESYISDRELKETSIYDIRRHMRTTFKEWAKKPTASITRDMVRKKFKQRSGESKSQANQGFRILRGLFNYARATYRPDDKPIILENPVSILSDADLWHHVKPRTGKVSTDRVGAFWNWIEKQRRAPEQTTTSRTIADCLAFMVLTGVRLGEALPLKWADTDLEDGFFQLMDTKNRSDITLPLSSTLVEILDQRPRTNEYVFPARSGEGHIKDIRGTLEKATETVGERIRPHDLRRTFRAVAGACGVEFWKTKLLMNHKPGTDVTLQSYTELSDLRYLRADAEKISKWVVQQGTIADKPKVVDLATRRAGK